MLAKVVLVPPNKDYVYLQQVDGVIVKLPRMHLRFVSEGDIGYLETYQGRPRLKLLTDDDDEVIFSHPDRKQLVPYGFFGPHPQPPAPIATPSP